MGLFSNIKNGVKKIGSAIRGGLSQIVNVAKEIVNRVFGVFDFLANLIGILLPKKLRLRVVILRNEGGSFLATAENVEPAIERAKAIFKAELNINTASTQRGQVLQYRSYFPLIARLTVE